MATTNTMELGWMQHPDLWLTTAEYARFYGRSQRTIKHWCLDGTLAAFHIQTMFLELPGKSTCPEPGRWYIQLKD